MFVSGRNRNGYFSFSPCSPIKTNLHSPRKFQQRFGLRGIFQSSSLIEFHKKETVLSVLPIVSSRMQMALIVSVRNAIEMPTTPCALEVIPNPIADFVEFPIGPVKCMAGHCGARELMVSNSPMAIWAPTVGAPWVG